MEEDALWALHCRALHDIIGPAVPCRGDGFCWLYAILAGMNALEDPSNPTTKKDVEVSRKYLNALKEHVRSGAIGNVINKVACADFLHIGEPPAEMLTSNNYGQTEHFRVACHFSARPIFIILPLDEKKRPANNRGQLKTATDRIWEILFISEQGKAR